MDFLSNHEKPAYLARWMAQLSRVPDWFRAVRRRLFLWWAGLPQLPRPRRLPAAAICLAGLTGIPLLFAIQPSIQVSMNGQIVGYVSDLSSVELAVNLMETSISTQFGVPYTLEDELTYETMLALSSQNDPVEDLVFALADASSDLETMAVLTVNGQTVGACQALEDVQSTLDNLLNAYKSSASDHARFVENVNVTLSPAPATAEMTPEELEQTLVQQQLLDVEVYSTLEYTEPIPYTTRKVQDEELDPFTVQTVQAGQDGEASVQATVVTLNGVETQRTIVSRAVLTQATDAVVAVGTPVLATGSSSMIAPVSDYTFTSAFKFRNGRQHKGVDLAVPEGTPVYASDSGTVIVAEWSDSYGNYVIIDHENGFKTVYAHNSSLLVQEGQTVTKGTMIALSGNTGNSTGPHVHFEIRYNDTAVDPELYIDFGEESP